MNNTRGNVIGGLNDSVKVSLAAQLELVLVLFFDSNSHSKMERNDDEKPPWDQESFHD